MTQTIYDKCEGRNIPTLISIKIFITLIVRRLRGNLLLLNSMIGKRGLVIHIKVLLGVKFMMGVGCWYRGELRPCMGLSVKKIMSMAESHGLSCVKLRKGIGLVPIPYLTA